MHRYLFRKLGAPTELAAKLFVFMLPLLMNLEVVDNAGAVLTFITEELLLVMLGAEVFP